MTREDLVEALQDAWDSFVIDTGNYPPDFEFIGNKLYAQFGASTFVEKVLRNLSRKDRLPPISDGMVAKVGSHHKDQFNDAPLSFRGIKLGEEAGEVMGAIVRHLEGRDGRSWTGEIKSEIGDVIVVLAAICYKLDLSLSDIARDGVEKFLSRTWYVGFEGGEA